MVGLTPDPVLRLSTLVPPDRDGIEALAQRLRLSNPVRDRLVAAAPSLDLSLTDRQARAALYLCGRAAFEDRVRRAEASALAAGESQAAAAAKRLLALADLWPIPRLPVGGRQVAAAGVPAGPDTGRILAASRRAGSPTTSPARAIPSGSGR